MRKILVSIIACLALLLVPVVALAGCKKDSNSEEKQEQVIKYSVTFVAEGRTSVVTVEEGKTVKKPTNPTKNGYTFDGWYTDENYTTKWKFTNKVTGDLTLYAKFVEDVEPIVEYNVVFELNNGTSQETTIASGALIERPADPTKNGYNFDTWYSDPSFTTLYNFNSPVTGNVTLYANYCDANLTMGTVTFGTGYARVMDCNEAATSVVIPSAYRGYRVQEINRGAFEDCFVLTSVVIPEGVKTISIDAFNGCEKLASITIPSTVESIMSGAFCYCSGLTSIVVANGNQTFDSRNNCNAIIRTETNELVLGCKSTVIPNTVTSIGANAFLVCDFETITIPASVETIGACAFSSCSNLTSVTIPATVTALGNQAFYRCSKLSTVTFTNNSQLQTIGDSAFEDCAVLTSFAIPDGVETISDGAFSDCEELVYLIIPASVTEIEHSATFFCTKLDKIYYKGNSTQWGQITVGTMNSIEDATVYFYSEEEPDLAGNYWHYDNDGVTPVVWEI